MNQQDQNEPLQELPTESAELDRRDFLKITGKYAKYTPVVLTTVLLPVRTFAGSDAAP